VVEQEPADLRSALGRMGSEGLISYRNLLPVMIVVIAGLTFGASLGPEAPLIVLIAGLASASRPALRRSFARAAAPDLDMVAVTASLGAFFGPLGGAALALEDEDGVRLTKARLLLPASSPASWPSGRCTPSPASSRSSRSASPGTRPR
jgi:H+/Cl- antiporter ClcA